MQIIADFHLHSKYSRATSRDMDVAGLSRGAKLKGLKLMGTGDFTHPSYFEDLKSKLQDAGDGLFMYDDVYFMLTAEVCTIFELSGRPRRVHHVIHAPSLEIVEQVNELLAKYGNLSSDGRPMLNISAAGLVELLIGVSKDIMLTPAHVWTPWFSIFGSKSGFNSVDECYGDQAKNIFSLETGLSSDPQMNWRLSQLDRFTLLSNSDSHSANPWRLGREANVFELEKVAYKEIYDAIKGKDKKKFLYTVEVDPNYGKYHFDGHKDCNISMPPSESKRLNGICPRCKRKLTIGVLSRVEELADRPDGFMPKDAIPFKSLLPLYEIISFATGTASLYSKKVLIIENKLLDRFGSEFNVLLNVTREELAKVVDEKIADAVLKIREGNVKFVPGYDGVYGKPIFDGGGIENYSSGQKSLSEF
jgi:uncharacterized protein (TIGR00375 family)